MIDPIRHDRHTDTVHERPRNQRQGQRIKPGRKHQKSPSVAVIGTRGYPSYYGGFETAVRRLAPYLSDQGWRVTVYGRPGETLTTDPTRDARVQTVITPGLNSKKASTLSFGFTSTLHAFFAKPDVALIMNCANGFLLPLLRLRRIPTAVNVDGMEWERAKWGRVARKVFKLGALFTARFANTIICDSAEIARRWDEDFGRKSQIIAYGGDAAEPSAPPMDLPYRGYVLLVARFVPENTISEFFDAVPDIAAKAPVVLVGSSGFADDFDQRARELSALPNVIALGHLSDDSLLHSLWQNAGVYFHGHSVGGTNPALVQAMACGAPIVARDTVFNREVLRDCATYATPSPSNIRDKILELLHDPSRAQELSDAASRRARDNYSWSSICEGYNKVATDLASR